MASRRTSTRRSSRAAAPSIGASRVQIVWVSFLGAMTLAGGLLLLIDGKPTPRTDGLSLSPLAAATTVGSVSSDPLTQTRAPLNHAKWQAIVIHHSGVDEGTVKGMDRYHREQRHMENGLAYHFVIGNGNGMRDGEIAVGQRWRQQLDGGHLRSESQNRTALGICLVGDFDKRGPSERQMQSLNGLVKALMKRANLSTSAVKTHRQINIIGTKCPGAKFPTKSFVAGLKK